MTQAVADAVANARHFEAKEIATGFSWPECPRWNDGLFWFSDMYTSTLKTIDEVGTVRVALDATDRASETTVPIVLGGFGWLPDGRLVVTSMHEKLVLVHDGTGRDGLSVYADVSHLAPGPINDMVVAADGHVYITQLGFDVFNGADPAPSPIIVLAPDGSPRTADAIGPLMGANGIALSADGGSVFTAEAFGNRILVMNRAADGELSDQRVFAECPFLPDGIGLDAAGGVWAAMPGSGYVARFIDGGEITDAVAIPLTAGTGSACLLGGQDRTTLYITVGMEVFDFEKSAREAKASVWTAQVETGAGLTRP